MAAPRSRPNPAGRRWEERLAAGGAALELLRVPAALFAGAVLARRAAYDLGLAPVVRAGVPVVSVGNLTTGGTGKTPCVALVARELARRGLAPGLLSRGYAAGADGTNEEARLLARLLPGVPHVQDPDRARGARALVARGVRAIVLDDGFQHRRLARDLDLVLVDATRPWGLAPDAQSGRATRALLPRGLLREPPSSLARADAVVVTRCDQAPPERLAALEEELAGLAPGRALLRAEHRPRALVDERGDEHPLAELRGREVVAASGIGHPAAFEATLAALGARVVERRVFPDHHAYTAEDAADLARAGERLVTTAKDAVKLAPLGVRFRAVDVELALTRGASVLEALLDALADAGREAVPAVGGARSLHD